MLFAKHTPGAFCQAAFIFPHLPVIHWWKACGPGTPFPRKAEELAAAACHSPAHVTMQQTCQGPGNLTHLFEGFLYLHQGVPVCNGLPRVCQHLIPVVPAQAFSIDAHTTDTYDLIVAHSEGETKDSARHPPRKGDSGVQSESEVWLAWPQGVNGCKALPVLLRWTFDTERWAK